LGNGGKLKLSGVNIPTAPLCAWKKNQILHVVENHCKLQLWDEINLPHDEDKQIPGPIITCIGFKVDPNAMMVTMSKEKCLALIKTCNEFLKISTHYSLYDFQSLQGHINWALNIYPKLCPVLCALYAKTAGQFQSNSLIHVNNDMH